RNLEDALALLPTPQARHGKGPGALGRQGGPSLPSILLPTPTVNDSRGGRNRTATQTTDAKHHDGLTLTGVAFLSGDLTSRLSDGGKRSTDQPLDRGTTGAD